MSGLEIDSACAAALVVDAAAQGSVVPHSSLTGEGATLNIASSHFTSGAGALVVEAAAQGAFTTRDILAGATGVLQ